MGVPKKKAARLPRNNRNTDSKSTNRESTQKKGKSSKKTVTYNTRKKKQNRKSIRGGAGKDVTPNKPNETYHPKEIVVGTAAGVSAVLADTHELTPDLPRPHREIVYRNHLSTGSGVRRGTGDTQGDYAISLEETATTPHFSLSATFVSTFDADKEKYEAVKENNKRYEVKLLTSGDLDLSNEDSDQQIRCSYAQTVHGETVNMGVNTTKIEMKDANPQEPWWKIYEEEQKERAAKKEDMAHLPHGIEREASHTIVERAVIQNVMAPLQRWYRLSSDEARAPGGETDAAGGLGGDSEDELSEEEGADSETNNDHAEARQEAGDDGDAEEDAHGLKRLWTYSCKELVDGSENAVTCMTQPAELLCASFGSTVFGNKADGHICLWSPKNMHHPTRMYTVPEKTVSSVAFSKAHPYLLAAGLYDGCVQIYDIRDSSGQPGLKAKSDAKHRQPVWDLLWQNEGVNSASGELMYSISSDGSVKQWSTKKGFLSNEIMSLKRVPNQAALLGAPGSTQCRGQASGMCFDFPSNDPTSYFVGTEEGIVHKCSVSYNEQVLQTYFGHQGPIYTIQCHKWLPNLFVTCSQDWTIKLWDQDQRSGPLASLCSSNEVVVDVRWSPFDSCALASASLGHRIDVWNLAESTKDPVIQHVRTDTTAEITCLAFAPPGVTATTTLLAGRDDSAIDVYKLQGDPAGPKFSDEDQIARAKKILELGKRKV